jgi:hypothetical protein
MNKEFIINPEDKLYNYYWKKIKEYASSFNGVDAIGKKLQSEASEKGVEVLSKQMINELCETAVHSMLVEILSSSTDVGYALEFFKDGKLNPDANSYYAKLTSKIKKVLSNSLIDITGNNQAIDLDKLKNSLTSTINNFYEEHYNYRKASVPVKGLQKEIDNVIENVFETKKTLTPNMTDSSGFVR